MTDEITIGPLQFQYDNGEMFVIRLVDQSNPEGDGDHIGTCELFVNDWGRFVAAWERHVPKSWLEDEQRDHRNTKDGVGEATRLLGFALFNHAKGNTQATETLMRKAYEALAGKEWDA